MRQIELPYRHFYYLTILKNLRRIDHSAAIEYLFNNVEENSNNWIDERYKHFDRPARLLEVSDSAGAYPMESLMKRIQGLPPEIRPVTDGPYTQDLSFDVDGDHIVVSMLGYKICDFREHRNKERVARILPLVEDLLPMPMTPDQYGVYRDVGSQFWRLVQERDRESMPGEGETAMDVGAHIGYRALAMHACVGESGKVYAIEVEDENYEVLLKNIRINQLDNFFGIQAAVDSIPRKATLHSRDPRSMAHGLRSFEEIQDPSAIDRKDNLTSYTKEVQSTTLDEVISSNGIESIDNMQISVTGHEIEVVVGINTVLPRIKSIQVSCPYYRNGIPSEMFVMELLKAKGFGNFRKKGSATIADNLHYSPGVGH
ncbi:MAG: hypothetical protein CMJ32_01575 [Phycisphaerae bacterium]|nr:hypothetical protein [Phycisphaerae bacterium]